MLYVCVRIFIVVVDNSIVTTMKIRDLNSIGSPN